MTPCTTPGHSTRKWLPVASALPCPTGGEASRPVQIAYVPAFPLCVHGRVSLFFVQSEGSPMTTKTTPTAPWRSRIVGSGEEAPDPLVANPLNWRPHPGPQRDALRGSLNEVGWVQQILVNRQSGHVVDGHARVEEALTRGEPTVPVLYVDLDPEEEALVLAPLDPIGAMATADTAKLEELLAGITVDDAGLLALLGELAGNDPKAGLTDPDEVPEPPEEPYVKTGDLR